jgi:hypothetical protein
MVLIAIGCVFLLQNLGYLPPNTWVNLWRLWPMVLVLAGLELLFGRRLPPLAMAALVLVVLVIGVAALGPRVPEATGNSTTQSATIDLGGASQAAVTLQFGAGQLILGPLAQAGPTTLASMQYDGPAGTAPAPQYSVSGGTGHLAYQVGGSRSGPNFPPFVGQSAPATRMEVELNPSVPISSLVVQTGAADAQLDLSSLQITNLDVSVGAATAWIRLPQTGATTARVNSGAATITLEIPQGVAAQIRHRGGLSTFTIDQSRFPQVGEGVYRSPDYDTAQNRVDLDLETGVTTIRIQ